MFCGHILTKGMLYLNQDNNVQLFQMYLENAVEEQRNMCLYQDESTIGTCNVYTNGQRNGDHHKTYKPLWHAQNIFLGIFLHKKGTNELYISIKQTETQ